MSHGKKKLFGAPEASKKRPPLGLVIALAAAGGMVVGSAGTYFFSKPRVTPKQSASPASPASPAAVGTPQAQTTQLQPLQQQQFTPAPQPPGEAPPGKVWSVEHGHWHNAPVAATAPATGPTTPVTVIPTTTTTPAPAAAPEEKKE